jgi:hypothetical protein
MGAISHLKYPTEILFTLCSPDSLPLPVLTLRQAGQPERTVRYGRAIPPLSRERGESKRG